MAKQVINIGTTANDGTGTPIRDAFDIVNDNFTELYSDDAGDVNSIVAGTSISVSSATGDVTVTNSSPNATHTGDVTGSAALTIAADAVTTAKVLNANITHAKLEARYTTAVTVSTLTGTYALDWSTGAVFVMSGSLSGAINFQFGSMKIGQVIDIYNLTGSQAVTFSTASGTPVFNKAGAVDYDGASTNLIQVQCVSDAANAVFNYAVSAYVSDPTPS